MSNKEIFRLQKRAAKGNLIAKLELARYYVWHDETKPVPPDKVKKASRYLDDCIRRGNAEAMLSLGAMYYMGRGVSQDYTKAIKWYSKAADRGNHWANNNLGYCHYYGKSIPIDYEKALIYFMKAACDGNGNSMYKIGDMYYNGYFVKQDYNTAYYWYNKAYNVIYEGGECYPEIAFRFGNCYFYGHGIKQDYLKSLYYYQKSEYYFYQEIKKGDPFAKLTLETVNQRLDELRQILRKDVEE
jgi:TPR repeat protein